MHWNHVPGAGEGDEARPADTEHYVTHCESGAELIFSRRLKVKDQSSEPEVTKSRRLDSKPGPSPGPVTVRVTGGHGHGASGLPVTERTIVLAQDTASQLESSLLLHCSHSLSVRTCIGLFHDVTVES